MRLLILIVLLLALTPATGALATARHVEEPYTPAHSTRVFPCGGGSAFKPTLRHAPEVNHEGCIPLLEGETRATIRLVDASGLPVPYLVSFTDANNDEIVIDDQGNNFIDVCGVTDVVFPERAVILDVMPDDGFNTVVDTELNAGPCGILTPAIAGTIVVDIS